MEIAKLSQKFYKQFVYPQTEIKYFLIRFLLLTQDGLIQEMNMVNLLFLEITHLYLEI